VLDIRAANPATITLPLTGGNGQPLTVQPGAISTTYLGDQSVHANNMAAAAITVANDALAAESVIDPKIKTVGINKVTYGTSIFAGDVVLTRGVGQPVIYLKSATSGPDPAQNPTGIYLFGQGDATNGTTGLTSHPYAVFQSGGLSFFSGGTGPQVLLTSTGLTIWTVQGDTTHPYFTVTATALTFVNGPNSVTINSNALAFVDGSNGNRLDMSSAGISVSNSTNKLVITAGALQLQLAGVAQVTINSSGVTVSNGGASSVVVTNSNVTVTANGAQVQVLSNEVVLVQGSSNVTLTPSGIGISGPGSNSVGITATGININGPSSSVVLTSGGVDLTGPSATVRIGDTGTSSAVYAQGQIYGTTGFATNRGGLHTAGITNDLTVSSTIQLHINGGIITGYSIIG
jgi:hypothetical protein